MFAYQKAQVSFKKLKEIGQEGRNSKVYLAHDQNLDAEIVIKEIKIKDGFSSKDYFKEAQALYKSTHPNIVQICYACEDDKKVYVASPFL
ncbi:protein kinase domain-containing protein [Pseudoalteromonas sp. ASV78]|uniref:protein kinase domain-containing protein n=1 Tax=Pseudoalteromonas sp. ASV78 TaxID=3397851 RepID=UPI0039FC81D7